MTAPMMRRMICPTRIFEILLCWESPKTRGVDGTVYSWEGRERVKEEIKKRIAEALGGVPEGYASDEVTKETIRCVLYGFVKEKGLQPIPAFRNPRYPEGPVDMVGIKEGPAIEIAFCSNPAVELDDVKRLDRVPCEKKFVITFSRNQKKVKLSTFYLKPGIDHIHVAINGEE